MIKLNEKELKIEVVESLFFDDDVQRLYDNLVEDIKDELEYSKDDYEKKYLEKMETFVNHVLTNEEKIEILEQIKDNYEFEMYRGGDYYNISINDEDSIKDVLSKWIEDKFGVEV